MEGETFQERNPQEERMMASSEKAFMQKPFEKVEAQGEILKKMISRLSKIKEDELMEPVHDEKEEKDGMKGTRLIMKEMS